jgi:uncharacterized repeat protein (TIGR03806 family)
MRADTAESGSAVIVEDLIMKALSIFLLMILFVASAMRLREGMVERKMMLSEYGFFQGKLRDLIPSENVLFYDVNTPLFSNYAEKSRFIVFPPIGGAVYNDSVAFDLPVGTILIKNFFYPTDFRDLAKGKKILETRLLVRQEAGWEAWPYIWNDDQTDAQYDPAGETKSLTYVDSKGKKRNTLYAIPNKNQCKGCHISNNVMLPIGITARQLNRKVMLNGAEVNQLDYWIKGRKLTGINSAVSAPRLAAWDDAASGPLNDRARAYLDVNCGHCHSRKGPANTSGLFLDIFETTPVHLGVNKTPVAAGRGAGNLKFDIVPGRPDESILVYRMKTTDPAIAMPEIGREQIHSEGVALIEEWIRSNRF